MINWLVTWRSLKNRNVFKTQNLWAKNKFKTQVYIDNWLNCLVVKYNFNFSDCYTSQDKCYVYIKNWTKINVLIDIFIFQKFTIV